MNSLQGAEGKPSTGPPESELRGDGDAVGEVGIQWLPGCAGRAEGRRDSPAPRLPARAATGTGTLPPVGALDQLRGDQGILARARSNSRIAVAIAAGAILLLAWIGWAIYVTSSKGGTAGLGVLIAWPAMLAALALISLPFIGGYLLVKRLSEDSGSTAPAEAEAADEPEDAEPDDAAADEDPAGEAGQDEDEEGDEEDEEAGEGEDDPDEEPDDDSEPDSEPEASKAG
jgi:hypothetical protein